MITHTQPDGHPPAPNLIDFDASSIWEHHYFDHGYSKQKPTPAQKNRRRNDLADMKKRQDFLESRLILLEENLKKIYKILTHHRAEMRSAPPNPSMRSSASPAPRPRSSNPPTSTSFGILESDLNGP